VGHCVLRAGYISGLVEAATDRVVNDMFLASKCLKDNLTCLSMS